MPRARSTFKLTDITRVIRAVKKAGEDVARTHILPDGTIVVVHGSEATSASDNPFDEWKAKRDAR